MPFTQLCPDAQALPQALQFCESVIRSLHLLSHETCGSAQLDASVESRLGKVEQPDVVNTRSTKTARRECTN